VSYRVVVSCKNELHHQPMQSCLLGQDHPLDFTNIATEELRGLTKRCFPREQNKPPIIHEEAVNNLLCHLDTYKSMGPDGIHPRVLRDLAKELAKPLSIIYQQSWLRGEVPDYWRIASVVPSTRRAIRRILGTTGLSA